MADDAVVFQNMDTWRGGGNKFGLTFKQVIIQHINRCVLNGSVEWHGGYWQEKSNPNQNYAEKYYVQNSREVYCNSVRMLKALMLGYFDEKMNKAWDMLEQEMNKAYAAQKKQTKEDMIEWYGFKIEWHIKLYEQLILLGKRLNFLEEEYEEDEI